MDEDQLLASSSEEDEEDGGGKKSSAISLSSVERVKAANYFGEDNLDAQDDDEVDDGKEGDSSSEDGADNEEEMDVDEDALNAELQTVNDKLAEEPYSYDLHLEKLKILKGLGDLEASRSAREKMSKLYPLSPEIWLEWIGDERKMLSIATPEEKEYVFSLMDRAVNDYTSVEVWLQYLDLVLTNMGDDDGVQRCRDVFERALGSCGLNVAMGSLIWDTYRDFEAALLPTLKTPEEQQQQERRYLALCKRQLAIPLLDMTHTYEQMKSKITLDENTENSYKKALERLAELQYFEAKLVQSSEESEKCSVYKQYVADEIKHKCNPARIQCLYERAVTECPLSSNVWLEYIEWFVKHLKIPDLIFSVCDRAARNCPWVVSIWTKYLWAVEDVMAASPSMDVPVPEGVNGTVPQKDKVFEKIKEVFESGLIYCPTVDSAGTLWLKYLEFLRRSLDYNKPDEKRLEIIRKTFAAANAHLVQLAGDPNDYVSEVLLFHVRFEAAIAKGMTIEVRELWKNILNRGYNYSFRVWLQYIVQEMKYGVEAKHIRNTFIKAISQVQDDPQTIANFWAAFERDSGDANTMQSAETKIAKALEYYSQHQVSSAPAFLPRDRKRRHRSGEQDKIPYKKEKFDNHRHQSKSAAVDDGNFKVPFLPPHKASKDVTGTGRAQSGSTNKKAPASKPDTDTGPGPVKHDPTKDNQSVFVSNLGFAVEEGQVKDFFTECGTVEEIRLVRDQKTGKSRGFAYVVFADSSSVPQALKLDRKPIDSRPVYVSKCDADKATRQPQFKYSHELETNKLFIKGLSFSTSQDVLRKLFEAFGPLNDCRLVTHKNGTSKGIAFVEFKTAADAKTAILKTDGTDLDGRGISVAFSNPPSKNAPKPLSFTSKRPIDPLQRRERNVFVPRALQVEQGIGEAGGSGAGGPKSNADFRSMFLKK